MKFRMLGGALLVVLTAGLSACQLEPRQTQAGSMARCLAYHDAITALRLPVQVDRVEWPGPPEECQPPELAFTGMANAAEIERALGFKTKIVVQGPPDLPAAEQRQSAELGPLQVRVLPPEPALGGETVTVGIELRNRSTKAVSGLYAQGTATYLLLGPRGEVVRFGPQGVELLVGLGLSCAPNQVCKGGMALHLPLDHFNADLPLTPGLYTLRVRLNELSIEGAAKNRFLSATLPDVPVRVTR